MKLENLRLQRVEFMPKQLEPGILYVSEKFGTAAHLCACGCGAKIRTPLGPTEWSVDEAAAGPSLWPSVGNWQQRCQSHYIIRNGKIIWAPQWTKEQIAAGRRFEQDRRRSYFDALNEKPGLLTRLWRWIRSLLFPGG
jgi:hypothetical protein